MRRTATVFVLLGGLACWSFACGGSVAGVGDGGSGDDGGGSGSSGGGSGGGSSGGSSGGASAPHCPASTPSPGGACDFIGLVCEYGSSPVQDCDTVATCVTGAWQFAGHNPGGLDCAPATGGQCPAAFASVPVGAHCDSLGLYCDYPQGRCACSDPDFGAEPVDASSVAAWVCQDPTGCPLPRPRLGTACSQEGQSCDYGECGVIPGGSAEQCTDGIWVEAFSACPALAGGPSN